MNDMAQELSTDFEPPHSGRFFLAYRSACEKKELLPFFLFSFSALWRCQTERIALCRAIEEVRSVVVY